MIIVKYPTMPESVKKDVDDLHDMIKQIHARYLFNYQREIEPFIQAIAAIKAIYPEPIIVPDEMASKLFLGDDDANTKS